MMKRAVSMMTEQANASNLIPNLGDLRRTNTLVDKQMPSKVFSNKTKM